MTLFHFFNCAILTFGPHAVYYSATPLSEYDTLGTSIKSAIVYLITDLLKLVCLATFLKVLETDNFDPYQFALTQSTQRNISQNHKFQAVGLGWAFADSVLHRLAPLWVGARGLEFTWDFILQGLEANANLPRGSIKGQALADFVIECSRVGDLPDEPVLELPTWKVYVDGASNEKGAGAGVILISPQRHQLQSALRFRFFTSNNEAEHEAMLVGLQLAKEVGAQHIEVHSNSQLLVNKIFGEYQTKGKRMDTYVMVSRELLQGFKGYNICQVPGDQNSFADMLAKLTTNPKIIQYGVVPVARLEASSIKTQGSWPFTVWGIDLVGSLPTGKGEVKYAIVVVNYFTKWVEAEPMNTVTSKKAMDFVIKNITMGSRKQFDSDLFTHFCNQHEIVKSFSTVAKSQVNGQVEVVNKILKTTLRKKFQAYKAHWPEELPYEAVIPVETTVPSHRPNTYDPTWNYFFLQESLDPIEELREQSQVQIKLY
uniref:Integrase catalytic domain-containing protein n=1 Tax=Cannabis sativa TaxID=3483 RepID=A0A803NMP5_CANSA